MSAQSLAFRAGLVRQHEIAGEPLTFRGVQVTATITWNPIEAQMAEGEINFEGQDFSAIEVSDIAVVSRPLRGETFKDASTRYHRVVSSIHLGNRWRCICEVSE